jgi:hypothetical protein
MPAPDGTAASLVFLGLPDFARRSAAEQASLRGRLDAAVARSIAPLAAADRIVADSPDGLAIAVLAAPAEALLAARRIRRIARGEGGEPFELRVGIDHGPVRVATGARGEPCLAGDGVATGAAVAGFAAPGRILVSRAFRDALGPEGRADRLQPAGTLTDANLRRHELYAFEGSGEATTALAAAAAPRRRGLVLAAVAIAGLLGTGVAVRIARERARAARRPAVVALAIEPWGDIVIDGKLHGRTPPLTRLEVPPGKRRIEIRHPPQPPVALQVELDPGEELAVRHSFAAPAAAAPKASRTPPKPAAEQPSRVRRMWNDFRKQAGF